MKPLFLLLYIFFSTVYGSPLLSHLLKLNDTLTSIHQCLQKNIQTGKSFLSPDFTPKSLNLSPNRPLEAYAMHGISSEPDDLYDVDTFLSHQLDLDREFESQVAFYISLATSLHVSVFNCLHSSADTSQIDREQACLSATTVLISGKHYPSSTALQELDHFQQIMSI
jgi:hypothetical protein